MVPRQLFSLHRNRFSNAKSVMPASPEDLAQRLELLGIEITTLSHKPLFTVGESRAHRGGIPDGHCKSLFLKDRKGRFWLIVALEDAEIDLKNLPHLIGSGRLSFASADLLIEVLGVTPGSVTPFALINDTGQQVKVILDRAMMAHHPLVNTATTTIASADLVTFIRDCGHDPRIVAISA